MQGLVDLMCRGASICATLTLSCAGKHFGALGSVGALSWGVGHGGGFDSGGHGCLKFVFVLRTRVVIVQIVRKDLPGMERRSCWGETVCRLRKLVWSRPSMDWSLKVVDKLENLIEDRLLWWERGECSAGSLVPEIQSWSCSGMCCR